MHRYIVRMPGGTFTWNADGSATGDSDYYPPGAVTIEASGDVQELASTGTTWSKHYNGGLYGRVKDCKCYQQPNLSVIRNAHNATQSTTSASRHPQSGCG